METSNELLNYNDHCNSF